MVPVGRVTPFPTWELAEGHFTLNASRFPVSLSARYDAHDFKSVSRMEGAPGELGRGDRLAVVFDNNTARQELLGDEKLFQGTGQVSLDFLAVGDDRGWTHQVLLPERVARP